jgi:hypothetical protein
MIRGLALRLPSRWRERPWLSAGWLQGVGDTLQRRQDVVWRIQWCFVAIYYFLLIVPAVLPQPASRAEFFGSLAGVAEILFWGIWWPGVILSMLLFGQFWCGVFCPDGALTEFASRHGRGGKIPPWVRWSGWPLLAFTVVVVYEHLVDAYRVPRAILVSVGGASLLALVCGYFLGRGKRAWCRYLCPTGSMFSLLARCAIFHYKVDRDAWDSAPKPLPRSIDCPPLLDVRRLRSNEKCSMCGRCSGHRNAVRLAWRAPGSEIASMEPGEIRRADAFAVCFVLVGLCYGAIHWRHGPVAAWLETSGSAFVSTHPGLVSFLSIVLSALMLGGVSGLMLLAAGRWTTTVANHLAYGLIPLAGLGLFLGALEHSFRLLAEAGFDANAFLPAVRAVVILPGVAWSLWVGRRVLLRLQGKVGRAGWLYVLLVGFLAAAYQLAPPVVP